MFLTAHVTECVCRAELKGYLLTYLLTRVRNVLGAKRPRGELTKGRNVRKSTKVHQHQWADACLVWSGLVAECWLSDVRCS